MRLRILFAGIAAAVLIGGLAHGQERPIGGIGITVFEDVGYRGRNATIRDEVSNLSDYHLNDRVSSFRIARGEFWEVCEHKDFGGRCAVFSADEPDLRRVSWDDQITSVRRVRRDRREERGRGRGYAERPRERFGIVMFEEEDLRGARREFEREETDLYGGRVSSLDVRGSWEICDRPSFRGRCVTVSGEVPSLRSYGMQNRIASARPLRGDRGDGRGSPPPDLENPRLILHSRTNFRGESHELTDADREISDFNDRAQSATVEGGTWEVCEHKEFRGRCVTLRNSVPDLGAYGLRDAISSARPISPDERR
ncbi:MAG: beta/gamma crystallin-related protein [Acidobacteriota bacterium]